MSEITKTKESVFSLIPIAARCLSPNLAGIVVESDTGRTTLVALMKFCFIIIAPS